MKHNRKYEIELAIEDLYPDKIVFCHAGKVMHIYSYTSSIVNKYDNAKLREKELPRYHTYLCDSYMKSHMHKRSLELITDWEWEDIGTTATGLCRACLRRLRALSYKNVKYRALLRSYEEYVAYVRRMGARKATLTQGLKVRKLIKGIPCKHGEK